MAVRQVGWAYVLLIRLLGLALAAGIVAYAVLDSSVGLFDFSTAKGNQTRGVVTDTIVNLGVALIGTSLCSVFRTTTKQTSAAVVVLGLVAEIVNFAADNVFRHDRWQYYVQKGRPLQCGAPQAFTDTFEGSTSLNMAYDIVRMLGKDAGIRTVITMFFNFMISVQFEGVITHSLRKYGLPHTFPVTAWWLVTLLCSSAINIIRFKWAYVDVVEADVATITAETVLLLVLLVAIQFMMNPYVAMPGATRVVTSVFLMILTLVAVMLNALDVPSCDAARQPEETRTAAQAGAFVLVFLLMILVSVYNMRKRVVPVRQKQQ